MSKPKFVSSKTISSTWLPIDTTVLQQDYSFFRTPTQWTTWPWSRCLPCTTSTCPKLLVNLILQPLNPFHSGRGQILNSQKDTIHSITEVSKIKLTLLLADMVYPSFANSWQNSFQKLFHSRKTLTLIETKLTKLILCKAIIFMFPIQEMSRFKASSTCFFPTQKKCSRRWTTSIRLGKIKVLWRIWAQRWVADQISRITKQIVSLISDCHKSLPGIPGYDNS